MSYEEAIHTENYKGFTITIIPDLSPENPCTAWDCNPPIAVLSDRSITEYGTEYGHANSVPTLSHNQIRVNAKALCEMTGYKTIRELARAGQSGIYETVTDIESDINEELREHVDNLSDSDRLEALETLYNFAGIPALVESIHGYSQGDYAEVLAIASPEFAKAIGTEWTAEQLAGSIKLFEDWAFGNVYGYEITDADGEHVDSCWGFYGDYDAKEYSVLNEARTSADYYAEQAKQKRFTQIKTWIKNRVPLIYRTN